MGGVWLLEAIFEVIEVVLTPALFKIVEIIAKCIVVPFLLVLFLALFTLFSVLRGFFVVVTGNLMRT